MQVKISWQDNVHFIGKVRAHEVSIDGSPDHGGVDKGVRPMEAVLMGLAACSAYDVVLILKKAKQPVADCEVDVSAERADKIPAVFTKIDLHFRFTSEPAQELDSAVLERATKLSVEKYCSAAKMLRDGGVQITHRYSINS